MRRSIAGVALALSVVGCGAGAGSGQSGSTLNDHDKAVVSNDDRAVKDWNAAARAWSRPLQAGDLNGFNRSAPSYMPQLNKAWARIRLSASQIENTRLRSLMSRLGDAYHAQFNGMVAVNDAAATGNATEVRSRIAGLRALGQRHLQVATQLADTFPELGRIGG